METSTACRKMVALVLIFVFLCCIVVPVGIAQEPEPSYQEEGSTASEAGLGAASFILTILYGAVKVPFALVGGLVGGLAYVFSGLNENVAKDIWVTSMYGTYIITPDHLKGEKPVRFLGMSDETVAEETTF